MFHTCCLSKPLMLKECKYQVHGTWQHVDWEVQGLIVFFLWAQASIWASQSSLPTCMCMRWAGREGTWPASKGSPPSASPTCSPVPFYFPSQDVIFFLICLSQTDGDLFNDGTFDFLTCISSAPARGSVPWQATVGMTETQARREACSSGGQGGCLREKTMVGTKKNLWRDSINELDG